MNPRKKSWLNRKERVRRQISGTTERPRLCVYKSLNHIYAQIIDDTLGATLVHASTRDKELKGKAKGTLQGATQIGTLLAKRAKQKGVQTVVFDRHGFRYHGQLKALADAAREGGLKF